MNPILRKNFEALTHFGCDEKRVMEEALEMGYIVIARCSNGVIYSSYAIVEKIALAFDVATVYHPDDSLIIYPNGVVITGQAAKASGRELMARVALSSFD